MAAPPTAAGAARSSASFWRTQLRGSAGGPACARKERRAAGVVGRKPPTGRTARAGSDGRAAHSRGVADRRIADDRRRSSFKGGRPYRRRAASGALLAPLMRWAKGPFSGIQRPPVSSCSAATTGLPRMRGCAASERGMQALASARTALRRATSRLPPARWAEAQPQAAALCRQALGRCSRRPVSCSAAPAAPPALDDAALALIDLPTSDESDALLRIRHTVRCAARRRRCAGDPRMGGVCRSRSGLRALQRPRAQRSARTVMTLSSARRRCARRAPAGPRRADGPTQSAHVLAMAVQRLFPKAQVTIGPWCVARPPAAALSAKRARQDRKWLLLRL